MSISNIKNIFYILAHTSDYMIIQHNRLSQNTLRLRGVSLSAYITESSGGLRDAENRILQIHPMQTAQRGAGYR